MDDERTAEEILESMIQDFNDAGVYIPDLSEHDRRRCYILADNIDFACGAEDDDAFERHVAALRKLLLNEGGA